MKYPTRLSTKTSTRLSTRTSLVSRLVPMVHLCYGVIFTLVMSLLQGCSTTEHSLPASIKYPSIDTNIFQTVPQQNLLNKAPADFSIHALYRCGALKTSLRQRNPTEDIARALLTKDTRSLPDNWGRIIRTRKIVVGIIPNIIYTQDQDTHIPGYDIILLARYFANLSRDIQDYIHKTHSKPLHWEEKDSFFHIVTRSTTYTHATQALMNQEVDLVIGAYDMTCDRASSVRFTQPYLKNGLALVTTSPSINSLVALAHKKICIIAGSSYGEIINSELIARNLAPTEIKQARSLTTCSQLLSTHDVDAIAAPDSIAMYLRESGEELYYFPHITLTNLLFSIAVNKNDMITDRLFNTLAPESRIDPRTMSIVVKGKVMHLDINDIQPPPQQTK